MSPAKSRRRGTAKGLNLNQIRKLALSLPGVEEGTSYGTPAFKVRGKLLARLKEDGESLVIKVPFDQREILMEADPKAYFITDHYRNYPMLQVRLSHALADELASLLEGAWRQAAPKKLIKEFDAAS